MIELRWLEKETLKHVRTSAGGLEDHLIGYEKVLQFRTGYETAFKELGGTYYIEWNDWQDIPTEREE